MPYETKNIAVVALFEHEGKYLFTYRTHTGAFDGNYLLPGGHVETGEKIREATVREIKEELGVSVHPNDLVFKLVKAEKSYVSYFFSVRKYEGNIINAEPEKHQHLAWLSPSDAKIPSFVAEELQLIQSDIHFAEEK